MKFYQFVLKKKPEPYFNSVWVFEAYLKDYSYNISHIRNSNELYFEFGEMISDQELSSIKNRLEIYGFEIIRIYSRESVSLDWKEEKK